MNHRLSACRVAEMLPRVLALSCFVIATATVVVAGGFKCATPAPPTYTGATTIFGWGVNWNKQLSSTKEIEPRPYPVLAGSGAMNVSKITGGYMHVAILDTVSSQAWFAGLATSGQLGAGPTVTTKQDMYLPIPFIVDEVEPELFNRSVFDVAAGYAHSCIITQQFNETAKRGVVYCTGKNDHGQLGRTDVADSVTYIQQVQSANASFTAASFTAIAAGSDHNIALTAAGEVWAWGANAKGQLGNGQTSDAHAPVLVAGLSSIVKVGCGFSYCLALDGRGTLFGWGANEQFQLGVVNAGKIVSTPVRIITGVSDFSCGGSHVLAVIQNRLYSWGAGTMGATGHPKNIPALILDSWTVKTPTPVADFTDVNIRSIAAGAKHSIVLDTCGTVYTMGSDAFGQLGQEKLAKRREMFRSLPAKTNANIARRGLKSVAVYASWFNSFLVTEEALL
jgi:alpha-tubulin suppressor-like RCC1 family protein